MSEIKVGQVWETTNKYKVVVTSVEEEDYKCQVCIIYDDGYTTDDYKGNNFTFSKLLAEYPTWQEAVNSKEFGGKPHINDDDDFEPLGCHGCGDW